MKKLSYIVALVCISLLGTMSAGAMDLISTVKPDKLIVVGVRAGFNTSNLSNNYSDKFPGIVSQKQQWRNGLSVGAVVDLNLTGFFTIQPGVFLSTRKNDYSMLTNQSDRFLLYQGSMNCNYFTVPILASFRMGVADLIQFQVDLGPYMAWGFGGKNKYKCYGYQTDALTGNDVPKVFKGKGSYFGNGGVANRYDYGVKTGVGILAAGKIYLGAHYMYGCRNALQQLPMRDARVKGHNKRWEFTVGFNL